MKKLSGRTHAKLEWHKFRENQPYRHKFCSNSDHLLILFEKAKQAGGRRDSYLLDCKRESSRGCWVHFQYQHLATQEIRDGRLFDVWLKERLQNVDWPYLMNLVKPWMLKINNVSQRKTKSWYRLLGSMCYDSKEIKSKMWTGIPNLWCP